LVSTEDKHKCTHQFIYQKLQGSGNTFTQGLSNKEPDTDHFSLADIYMLKNGLADPSDGLVAALRIVLRGVITEYEIDKHLVRPFQTNPETSN